MKAKGFGSNSEPFFCGFITSNLQVSFPMGNYAADAIVVVL